MDLSTAFQLAVMVKIISTRLTIPFPEHQRSRRYRSTNDVVSTVRAEKFSGTPVGCYYMSTSDFNRAWLKNSLSTPRRRIYRRLYLINELLDVHGNISAHAYSGTERTRLSALFTSEIRSGVEY